MGKGYYVSFKVAICLGVAVIVVIVAVGLVVGLVTEKVQSDQKSDITTRAPIESSTFKASTEPFTSQASSEPFTSQASSEPFTSQASSEPFTSQASSEPFTSQASSEPFTSQASSEPSTQNIPDTTPSQDQFSYRLPNNVIPIHYELELQPFLDLNDDAYNFSGKVEIFMQCTNSTSTLLIHSHKLQYDGPISLVDDEGQILNVTPGFDTKHQYLTLDVNLKAGKSYTFVANFRGNLTNDLAGFYRSEYMEKGKTKVMATSQMEPADARKAFPCFDEPAMKATFNVTLIHNCDRVPLSNMPNISTTSIDERWCKTKFSQTPRMSTYLMAFIVSDFTCIEGEANTTRVRVFARKSEIDAGRAQYALNVAKTVLNYFGDLFDYPYFLPKSDQIGIPDFAAGAMENWGLVTYRETALLYDKNDSSESNKERVVSVIAHELTHQWFGDLVTIGWWSELWLNEGFATYFSYLGTDAVETTWNFTQGFVLDDFQRALLTDSYSSSRALSAPEDSILKPADLSSVFDDISYSKGGSILRMMHDIFGTVVFIDGLNTYLKARQFNDSKVIYLLDHLQQSVDDHNVSLPALVYDIFSTWTNQMGYPCVSINKSGNISQNHFLMNPTSNVTRISPPNYIWGIPIRWISSSYDDSQTEWLLGKQGSIPFLENDTWVLLNANAVGFYRVHYDDELFSNLLKQLQNNYQVIPLENRAQLIDDTFNLATAGMMKIEHALNTTIYLVNETKYIPWQTALNNLGYIDLMFSMSMSYGNLQTYMQKQITTIYDDYKNFTSIPELHFDKIHPNLRYTVYCYAIAAGGIGEWEFALKMYKNSSFSMEKAKLLSALACSKEPWILSRLLSYTLEESIIRKQDATKAIISVANNVVGQSLAWSFLKEQWDFIFKHYGVGAFSSSDLITGVTQRFSTDTELKELQDFKESIQDFGSGTAAMERALEQTNTNIKWRKDNEHRINIWFKANME